MNGREQVKAMAKLMNSDQRAPAGSAWQADQIGGIKIGDAVQPTFGNLESAHETH